jgi:hypothetical protein
MQMKTAIAMAICFSAISLAATVPASAKLTAFGQQPFDQPPDVTSLYTGPAAATLERRYFEAPPQPAVSKRVLRCTVQMIVFEKARLAQACY